LSKLEEFLLQSTNDKNLGKYLYLSFNFFFIFYFLFSFYLFKFIFYLVSNAKQSVPLSMKNFPKVLIKDSNSIPQSKNFESYSFLSGYFLNILENDSPKKLPPRKISYQQNNTRINSQSNYFFFYSFIKLYFSLISKDNFASPSKKNQFPVSSQISPKTPTKNAQNFPNTSPNRVNTQIAPLALSDEIGLSNDFSYLEYIEKEPFYSKPKKIYCFVLHTELQGLWIHPISTNLKTSNCESFQKIFPLLFPSEKQYFKKIDNSNRKLIGFESSKNLLVVDAYFFIFFSIVHHKTCESFITTNLFRDITRSISLLQHNISERKDFFCETLVNKLKMVITNDDYFEVNETNKIISAQSHYPLRDLLDNDDKDIEFATIKILQFFENKHFSSIQRFSILNNLLLEEPLRIMTDVAKIVVEKLKQAPKKFGQQPLFMIHSTKKVQSDMYIKLYQHISNNVLTAIKSVTQGFTSEHMLSMYHRFLVHNLMHNPDKRVSLMPKEVLGGVLLQNYKKIFKLSALPQILLGKLTHTYYGHLHWDGFGDYVIITLSFMKKGKLFIFLFIFFFNFCLFLFF
jgi:hypothetical protein